MSRKQAIDFSIDVMRALLWQYNDATNLQAVLQQKNDWYELNQKSYWEDWTRDVFNLRTANEFGLSVWAIILDIQLAIGLPGSGSREVFGFGDANLNFENGNFGRDQSGVAGLTTGQKRLVLVLRYYQLISDGTAPFTNYVLKDVFGAGYVLDHMDMTCSYVFPQALPSMVALLLETYDLLPRPAGVEINILVNPEDVFGFAPVYLNFENGQFGE